MKGVYFHKADVTFAKIQCTIMNLLEVRDLSRMEDGKWVVGDINFSLSHLKNIGIAGETGSGKSTLLKMVAGLLQPTAGEVLFDGKRVWGPLEKLLPGHPKIAYLSQHFELRNNYTVEEVLELTNRMSATEALTVYKVCKIDHLLQRKTDQVSGGEKQRIALARLLTASPKLLLLDEPFSNLDLIHKNILKSVIKNVRERLGVSCIMVSHDPVDLLSWAHNILVLKDGCIVQAAAPATVYRQPANTYVAGLFGKYNLLTENDLLENDILISTPFTGKHLLCRPEHFVIHNDGNIGKPAVITNINYTGWYSEVKLQLLNNKQVLCYCTKHDWQIGQAVRIELLQENVTFV